MMSLRTATKHADEVEDVLHNSSKFADESSNAVAKKKPYSKSRPKYGKGQVEEVWENAKDVDGNVYDPNTGELLTWDKSKNRNGQWDMGHKQNNEYRKLHKDYMDEKLSKEEFLKEYRDPKNYQPESPGANRSRKFEAKND